MSEAVHSTLHDFGPHDASIPTPLEVEQPLDNEASGIALAVDSQRLLWRNRVLVVRVAAAGLLLSIITAFLIPRRYTSTSILMPPDQDMFASGLAALAASGALGAQFGAGLGPVAGDLLGIRSSSALFIGIMQSRTVQDDLIEKFNLMKVYSDRKIEDARHDLSRRTELSADRKSGVLTIQVVDRDPRRAAAMAREYSSELNRVVTELNTSSAHRERVFLEERLKQVRRELDSAEKNFSEFATNNTALDVPTQGKAMIEAAASLDGQLIAARAELQSLRQTYTDQNLRVRTQQARVTELNRQLTLSVRGPSAQDGGTAGSSSYHSIRELPALGVGYSDLYRNTKIQESVYQTLTQEFELAKVQEAKETPSVKILDPPDVPETKSFPPRLWIVALGTLLSIAGSIAWIFGMELWQRTDPMHPQKAFLSEVFQEMQELVGGAGRFGRGSTAKQC